MQFFYFLVSVYFLFNPRNSQIKYYLNTYDVRPSAGKNTLSQYFSFTVIIPL